MLFGKKKKKDAPISKQARPMAKKLWSKEFTQSSTFKGYRRIKLSRFRSDEVDATINGLKRIKYDLKGRTIRLDLYESTERFNEYKEIRVYIDGYLIGSVFNSDETQFSMLTDYEYDKVHLRVEDSAPDQFYDNIVTARAYLFVHYPAVAPVKITIE